MVPLIGTAITEEEAWFGSTVRFPAERVVSRSLTAAISVLAHVFLHPQALNLWLKALFQPNENLPCRTAPFGL